MFDFDAELQRALNESPLDERAAQNLARWWKLFLVAADETDYRTLDWEAMAPDTRDSVMQINGLGVYGSALVELKHRIFGNYRVFVSHEAANGALQTFYAAFERRWASPEVYSEEFLAAEQALSDLLGGQLIVTRGRILTRNMLDEQGRIRQEVLDADHVAKEVRKATVSEQLLRYLTGLWRYLELSKLDDVELQLALLGGYRSKEDDATYNVIINNDYDDGITGRVQHAGQQLYMAYLLLFGVDAAVAVTDLLTFHEGFRETEPAAERDGKLRRAKAAVNTYTGARLDITSGSIVVVSE